MIWFVVCGIFLLTLILKMNRWLIEISWIKIISIESGLYCDKTVDELQLEILILKIYNTIGLL